MRNNEEKYEKEDYTMRYLGCIKQIAMHRAAFSPSSCVQSKLRSAPLAEHSVPSHPSQTKPPKMPVREIGTPPLEHAKAFRRGINLRHAKLF